VTSSARPIYEAAIGGGGSGAGDGVLDSRQRGVVVEPGRYEAAAGVSPSCQATHNRVRVSC
jgi:hypothetical protein